MHAIISSSLALHYAVRRVPQVGEISTWAFYETFCEEISTWAF
jgi:hypothetical protein